jgi:hypothetical protein
MYMLGTGIQIRLDPDLFVQILIQFGSSQSIKLWVVAKYAGSMDALLSVMYSFKTANF